MEQRVVFGQEESKTFVRALIKEKGWDGILLITGKKSFEQSGASEFIQECIASDHAEVRRFSDFETNPKISDLKKALRVADEFNPSAIIAIGGGSVMDMGKLIRFFLTHDGEIFGDNYLPNGRNISLIAVPTTAGTGSEATHFAVLYDEEKKKHSIADKTILPDYAVINPGLTYGQSAYLTACAGFDALAQGIEAYWNRNATEESDGYALKAIELIYDTLPQVVKDPTLELRRKMSEGAYWAGRAINITKTTAPHAFSYPFTVHYGIPHGHAVAIVFPAIAEFNIMNGEIPSYKTACLKKVLELRGDIYDSLVAYVQSIGLDLPVRDYDTVLLEEGINLERLANNPGVITSGQSLSILRKALNHPSGNY